jgi:gamma-glutamylaminecyclotransferase
MADATLVFVYGSLLRGEANAHLLDGVDFLGPASTPAAYRLLDLGPYPGLVAGGSTAVLGEVYRVPANRMGALDELEDHPRVYIRMPIALDDGRAVVTYLLNAPFAAGKPEVASGDWRLHLRSRRGP